MQANVWATRMVLLSEEDCCEKTEVDIPYPLHCSCLHSPLFVIAGAAIVLRKSKVVEWLQEHLWARRTVGRNAVLRQRNSVRNVSRCCPGTCNLSVPESSLVSSLRVSCIRVYIDCSLQGYLSSRLLAPSMLHSRALRDRAPCAALLSSVSMSKRFRLHLNSILQASASFQGATQRQINNTTTTCSSSSYTRSASSS